MILIINNFQLLVPYNCSDKRSRVSLWIWQATLEMRNHLKLGGLSLKFVNFIIDKLQCTCIPWFAKVLCKLQSILGQYPLHIRYGKKCWEFNLIYISKLTFSENLYKRLKKVLNSKLEGLRGHKVLLVMSLNVQVYPQRIRLQRRLYGICLVCFIYLFLVIQNWLISVFNHLVNH